MPTVLRNILNLQTFSTLACIRTAAKDLVSKGVTVEEIENAIRADGLPVLPEVHAILIDVERNSRMIVS